MAKVDQQRWMEDALDEVFRALATAPALREMLIFKGARILRMHRPELRRGTTDIDANLSPGFLAAFKDRGVQRQRIEATVTQALDEYFQQQALVRYTLRRVRVEHRPRNPHAHGWDGFRVTIALRDGGRNPADTMPTLSLDLAAPEDLTVSSTSVLDIGGVVITAYSEPRITAEKLRAYLERLPAHQAKIGANHVGHRVKDLYDVAVVLAHRPSSDVVFWQAVAAEFAVACASRAVDCEGMRSFEQDLAVAADVYRSDATIPGDRSFESVWDALHRVVALLEEHGVIPARSPLLRP